jgi:regulator of protease activity HflC (stomatin/prohibitin superfamily)
MLLEIVFVLMATFVAFCAGLIVLNLTKILLCALITMFVVFVALIYRCIVVINAPMSGYVKFLGTPTREVASGIHFLLWPMEILHRYKWRLREEKTRDYSEVVYHSGTSVSKAEMIYDTEPYRVITRDSMEIVVNLIIYYKINDLYKAYFEVNDPLHSMEQAVLTGIREVAAGLTIEEAVNSKSLFEEGVSEKLSGSSNWGIEITRVDIQNIDQPKEILKSTMKTLTAKRQANEEFLRRKEENKFSMKRIEMDHLEEMKRIERETSREKERLMRDHDIKMTALENEISHRMEEEKCQQELQRMKNERAVAKAISEAEVARVSKEVDINAKVKEVEGMRKAGMSEESLVRCFHSETMRSLAGKNVQFLPQSSLDLLGATSLYKKLPS